MIDVKRDIKWLLTPTVGWYAALAAAGLAVTGIIAMGTDPDNVRFAVKQTQWLALSFIGMVICALPHPKVIGRVCVPLMIISSALLLFVLLPFVPESIVKPINGTRAWINLRVMNFQPSELSKITFILAMAWYLRFRESHRTIVGLAIPFAIMLIPVVLILREPDLGTAILFPPALFAMLMAAGAKLKHIFSLIGMGLLLVAVAVGSIYVLPDSMQILKEHQRKRITSMIGLASNTAEDLQGSAYQQHKAMTLIGAGQTHGYGKQRSATIVDSNKLPESHNDMVFAVIVNRWGLLGGALTLGLHLMLFASLLAAAGRSKEPFTRLVVVGFAALFFTQMTINVGMNLGVLPIIGITLPFVSYGGTSLLTAFAMIGLAINFSSRPAAILTRPSFEFDEQ